jgi:hypothetical protein
MKKQIKKLSLNKKTISNLQPSEMNKMIGGVSGYCTRRGCGGTGHTKNGKTCYGHNTC